MKFLGVFWGCLGFATIGVLPGRETPEADDYIQLIEAARMGELAKVQAALNDGIPIDQTDGSGWTPLIHALDAGQNEVARYLVEKGANVTVRAGSDFVLNFAVRSASPEVIRLLLDRGAEIEAVFSNESGYTQSPVSLALIHGNLEALQEFARRGVNLRTWQNRSREDDAASLATMHRNIDCLRYLLEHGVNPNRASPSGNYLITGAALEGYADIVELLLQRGADPNLVSEGRMNITDTGPQPHTALICAVRRHDSDLVARLLQAGADPKLLDNAAIKFADLQGNRKIFDLLLAHGADQPAPYAFAEMPHYETPDLSPDPERVIQQTGIDWTLHSLINGSSADKARKAHAGLAQPVQAAVIVLDDTLKDLGALMTAELSQIPNLTVLERSEVDNIIAEKSLQETLYSDPSTVSRSGQLLGADCLVVLRRVEQAGEARILSTATGLVIDTLYTADVDKPEALCRDVAGRVLEGSQKIGRRSGETILVSIPSFTASESTPAAQLLERRLALALAFHLGRQENVYVLDRTEMQRMALEKDLQANTQAFFASGWLLDGNIDLAHEREGKSFTVTLKPRARSGRAIEPMVESGEVGNPQPVLQRIMEKLMIALRQGETEDWSPETEAQAYFKTAQWAYKVNLLQLAQTSAEAAWVLGRQDRAVLNLRLQSMVQRIRIARHRIKAEKLDRIYGNAQLIAYRAPLLLPRTDPDELTADDYLELAEGLLDGFTSAIDSPAPLAQEDWDLVAYLPEMLKAANAPLELLHSLSDEHAHAPRLAALRARLQEITNRALQLAREHDDPEIYHNLLGAKCHHLPYWIREEDRFLQEMQKIIEEARELDSPYSIHAFFGALKNIMDPHMNKYGGQAPGLWSSLAHEMSGTNDPHARLLGLEMCFRDTNSVSDKVALRAKIIDAYRALMTADSKQFGISIEYRLPIEERTTIKGLSVEKPRPPISHPAPWYTGMPTDAGIAGQFGVFTVSWKVPGTGQFRITPAYRKLHQELVDLRLRHLAKIGGGTFRFFGKLSNHPSEVLDRWHQWASVAQEKYEAKDRQQSRVQQASRRFKTFYVVPLEELLAARGADRGNSKIVLKDLSIPVLDPKLSSLVKEREDFVHTFQEFASIRGETWMIIRNLALVKLAQISQFAEIISLPEEIRAGGMDLVYHIGDDYVAVFRGYSSTERAREAPLFVRSNTPRRQNTISVFHRRSGQWKQFPSRGMPARFDGVTEMEILGDQLVYSYLFHPEPNASSVRELLKDPQTTTGLVQIDLRTGAESLLVSSRRNPGVSPLDNTFGPYQIGQISDSQLRCAKSVYDLNDKTWRKALPAEIETAKKRSGRHGTRRYGDLALSNPTVRNGATELFTNVSSNQFELSSQNIRLPLEVQSASAAQIPAAWDRLRRIMGRERSFDSLGCDLVPEGMYLSNELGFFFVSAEELANALEAHSQGLSKSQ